MPSYKTCYFVQWYRISFPPAVLLVTENGESCGDNKGIAGITIERKFPGKVYFTDDRGGVTCAVQASLTDNTCGVIKGNVYFVRRVLLDLDADKTADQLEQELLARQEKYRNIEQIKYEQDQYTNGQAVPDGFLNSFTQEQDRAGAGECTDIHKLAQKSGAKMLTAEAKAALERESRRAATLEARLAASQCVTLEDDNLLAAPVKRRIHPSLAGRAKAGTMPVVDLTQSVDTQ